MIGRVMANFVKRFETYVEIGGGHPRVLYYISKNCLLLYRFWLFIQFANAIYILLFYFEICQVFLDRPKQTLSAMFMVHDMVTTVHQTLDRKTVLRRGSLIFYMLLRQGKNSGYQFPTKGSTLI